MAGEEDEGGEEREERMGMKKPRGKEEEGRGRGR